MIETCFLIGVFLFVSYKILRREISAVRSISCEVMELNVEVLAIESHLECQK